MIRKERGRDLIQDNFIGRAAKHCNIVASSRIVGRTV